MSDDTLPEGWTVADVAALLRSVLPWALGEGNHRELRTTWDVSDRRGVWECRVFADGVRASASLLGLSGEALAVDTLVEALEACSVDELHDQRRDVEVIDNAVCELLSGLDASSPEVQRLARSGDARVRINVADSLSLRTPAGRALLFELAADPVPAVRKAANASLRGLEVPWWLGVFSVDPLQRVTGADEEAKVVELAVQLHALEEFRSRRTREFDPARLAQLFRDLPAPLAAEAIPRLLEKRATRVTVPLVGALLWHPGNEEVFAGIVRGRRWVRDLLEPIEAKDEAVHGLAGILPDDRKLAVCFHGLAVIRQLLRGKRSDDELRYDTRIAWLSVIEALWPEGADVDPILDLLCYALELEETSDAYVLARVLEKQLRPEHRAMRRLIEARDAGWPGEFRPAAAFLRRVLDSVSGADGG